LDKSSEFVKRFEPSAFDQLGANRLQNILEMDLPRPKALLSHRGYEMGQGALAGGAIAVIVVICVGFLLILLVVGVLKMRDTPMPRRRRQRKSPSMQHEGGMEWDDSGLNITVNPLDDVEKQENAVVYSEEEEEESSDDGESYHDEDEYSEEESETMPALPHSPNAARQGGLEWDEDASLQASTNISRTYRV